MVSQRVDILNGTLRDNLKLAKPDATDEVLSDILQQVGLDKLLQDAALNTRRGEGGRQLSGGENVGSALREHYCIMLNLTA